VDKAKAAGLLVSGAVGVGLGWFLSTPKPLRRHEETIKRIKIYSDGWELKPKLLFRGKQTTYYTPSVAQPKSLYAFLWVDELNVDVGALADVWDLGDGTVNVEIARMNAGELHIYIDGVKIAVFPSVTDFTIPAVGYLSRSLKALAF
jgi:hypothetical protein